MDITKLQIKVFKNVSDNPSAPAFRGILCDPSKDYEVVGECSLWYATDKDTGEQKLDKNGNPFLNGKTAAPYKK